MPNAVVMSNRQKVSAGVTILDQDGQPFAEKPETVTVEFSSSDPAVADFTVSEGGLSIEIRSGQVGNAVITARATGLPTGEFSDTLSVAVQNSAPNSVNFTVGTPVDE